MAKKTMRQSLRIRKVKLMKMGCLSNVGFAINFSELLWLLSATITSAKDVLQTTTLRVVIVLSVVKAQMEYLMKHL